MQGSIEKPAQLSKFHTWESTKSEQFPGFLQGLSGQSGFHQFGHEKLSRLKLFLFKNIFLNTNNQEKMPFFYFSPPRKAPYSINNPDFIIPEHE